MSILSKATAGALFLALSSTAMAADLAHKKAAPVSYVKICSTYGAGFFYVPGSNTCLAINGAVRAEYYYNQPYAKSDNTTSTYVRGQVALDARTATEYGLLRTYMSYNLIKGSSANLGTTGTELENAFIQFGGLTAGRIRSFFDFYGNEYTINTVRGADIPGINVLAYSAEVAKGVTATLSLEDGVMRRVVPAGVTYGGHVMPDVVAAVKIEQSWGSFQLSGASHQLRSNLNAVDTKYGYAAQAGVKIKLESLSPEDVLALQGTYANGAVSYLNLPNSLTAGGLAYDVSDFYLVGTTIKPTTAYALTAALKHHWNGTSRSVFFGSYANINHKGAGTDMKELFVGANYFWSPVAGLDIGPEVTFRRTDPKGGRSGDNWGTALRVERLF